MATAHKVQVTLHQGKPVCVPSETEARRGDTITWQGETHTGSIDGKIDSYKARGFSESELKGLKAGGKVDPVKCPMEAASWTTLQTLRITMTAEPGTYSYTVRLSNGAETDPIIIIGD